MLMGTRQTRNDFFLEIEISGHFVSLEREKIGDAIRSQLKTMTVCTEVKVNVKVTTKVNVMAHSKVKATLSLLFITLCNIPVRPYVPQKGCTQVEYLFVWMPPGLSSASFNKYCTLQGVQMNGTSIYICSCGVVEYCASQNVTPVP